MDEIDLIEERLGTAEELLDEVLSMMNNAGIKNGLSERIIVFLNEIQDDQMSLN